VRTGQVRVLQKLMFMCELVPSGVLLLWRGSPISFFPDYRHSRNACSGLRCLQRCPQNQMGSKTALQKFIFMCELVPSGVLLLWRRSPICFFPDCPHSRDACSGLGCLQRCPQNQMGSKTALQKFMFMCELVPSGVLLLWRRSPIFFFPENRHSRDACSGLGCLHVSSKTEGKTKQPFGKSSALRVHSLNSRLR
jgi:hypothetical protein